MSWLQIETIATATTVAAVEDALFSAGALSVALVSETDEPVLEPSPGEMPLWSSVRMQGLFPIDLDLRALLATLHAADLDTGLDVRFVGEEDWQRYARSFAVDETFGGRIHLRPPLGDGEIYAEEGLVPLYLEPGLAFGSGSHPTTRLCLTWLAEHVEPGWKVLDFGCGSGVLGIAAALLGAEVVAVDHDPQAVLATGENAARNGVVRELSAMSLEEWRRHPQEGFDAVVANILAEPLRMLATEFVQATAVGGSIVLAGLLVDQEVRVRSAYPESVRFLAPIIAQEWSCLVGVKSDL